MNKPREVLLERHRDAEPELERICQRLLAGLPGAPGQRPSVLLARCWQELFWSCRRAWTGVAAAWGAMVLIHLLALEPARPEAALAILSREEIAWLVKENTRLQASGPSLPREPAIDSRPRPGRRGLAPPSCRQA
jgi:hypothetical protein